MTGEEIDAMTGNQAREALSVFVRQFAEYKVASEDTINSLQDAIRKNNERGSAKVAEIKKAAHQFFLKKYKQEIEDAANSLANLTKKCQDLTVQNNDLRLALKKETESSRLIKKQNSASKKNKVHRKPAPVPSKSKSFVDSVAIHLL